MSDTRLKQLEAFLSDSPNDAFILFAIAKEYEGRGNDDKAFHYYHKIYTQQPDYIGTYYHLGKLYERQDQIEKAFQIYKEGIKIAQRAGDQHAASELAGAKLLLGDEEDFE